MTSPAKASPEAWAELLADLGETGRRLSSLTAFGLGAGEAGAARARSGEAAAAATVPGTEAAQAPPAPAPETLEEIRAALGDCRRCRLAGGRKTIVFGQGNPRARLMFVGEGPGADEDVQGLAFVGRAGQLLTDIIEKGMRTKREDVFIANIVKCRPPDNRDPEPDEILACQGFLERQVDAIRPQVIVALGKFAAQWLLKTTVPISRLRGRFGLYRGIQVMPTWHPAYLLRNPSAKREVWEDVKKVLAVLDAP